MNFSERLGLARLVVITDDAPVWFREPFYQRAIAPFVLAGPYEYPYVNANNFATDLLLAFRMTPIQALPVRDEKLKATLLRCEWHQFYDAIERFGVQIKAYDAGEGPYSKEFAKFRQLCNECLQLSGIGWTLTSASKLERASAESLTVAESQLASLQIHEPARVHIAKARQFLQLRPCDAANAIKECVSSLESAGRRAFPGTSGLGEVVKALRKQGSCPPLLVTIIEKMYAFASDEPGVRHGSEEGERVTRAEAEFIYATTAAIFAYMNTLGTL